MKTEVNNGKSVNRLSVIGIDEQIKYQRAAIEGMEKEGLLENLPYEDAILRSLYISKWITDLAVESLKKEEGNQPTEPGQVEELVDGLKKAKAIIRGWHSLGHRDTDEEKAMWGIYDRRSPEMKMINDVLSKYEDNPSPKPSPEGEGENGKEAEGE